MGRWWIARSVPGAAPTRVLVLLAAAVAWSVVFVAPARAACDGCPPVARHVEIDLADGRTVRGVVPVHPDDLAVSTPDPAELASGMRWWGVQGWPESPEGCVDLWVTWEKADRTPFAGYLLDRNGLRPGTFRLPPAIILVGDPVCVPAGDVDRIEDGSGGGGAADGRRLLRIRAGAAPWLDRDPFLALSRLCGDDELYCFSFDPAITIEALAARCQAANIADDQVLVLFSYAGT